MSPAAAAPPVDVSPDRRHDWEWSLQHEQQAGELFREWVFREFVVCRMSNLDLDMNANADMTVDIGCKNRLAISVRCRRVETAAGRNRDITIRASRSSGAETELQKIIKGFGDYMVYCWVKDDHLEEYVVLDLHELRSSGLLLDDLTRVTNRDLKSTFVVLPVPLLQDKGVLVDGRKYPNAAVSFRWTKEGSPRVMTDMNPCRKCGATVGAIYYGGTWPRLECGKCKAFIAFMES